MIEVSKSTIKARNIYCMTFSAFQSQFIQQSATIFDIVVSRFKDSHYWMHNTVTITRWLNDIKEGPKYVTV